MLITKPEYERTVTHNHAIPDECTIIEFQKEFYDRLIDQYDKCSFLSDNDIHSTLLHVTPETEFLHFCILQLILTGQTTKLQVDNLVIEIVQIVMRTMANYYPNENINSRLKRNHLTTIERAKEFIIKNFTEDISLIQIADYCYVSPFHFSRIFKTITSCSPHKYLQSVRLKNAEILLRNSKIPIADIVFSSGFNSVEHFTSAFQQKYDYPPARYRHRLSADISAFPENL